MSSSFEDRLTGRFGRPLRHLAEVASTNAEALEWLASDPPAPEGAVVVADRQTAGRGRWGRSWVSSPEASLVFSLVLRPAWASEYLGLMTVAAGLACAQGLIALTGIPARLKWPNDVLVHDRKLAGILTETRVSGHEVDGIVVGIGVNLDLPAELPPEIAERATGLAVEARRAGSEPPERAVVLAAILQSLEAVYDAIGDDGGRAEVRAHAAELMDLLGHEVDLRFPDGRTERVTATRLLEDGSLEVETSAGPSPVHVAEVERVLVDP